MNLGGDVDGHGLRHEEVLTDEMTIDLIFCLFAHYIFDQSCSCSRSFLFLSNYCLNSSSGVLKRGLTGPGWYYYNQEGDFYQTTNCTQTIEHLMSNIFVSGQTLPIFNLPWLNNSTDEQGTPRRTMLSRWQQLRRMQFYQTVVALLCRPRAIFRPPFEWAIFIWTAAGSLESLSNCDATFNIHIGRFDASLFKLLSGYYFFRLRHCVSLLNWAARSNETKKNVDEKKYA